VALNPTDPSLQGLYSVTIQVETPSSNLADNVARSFSKTISVYYLAPSFSSQLASKYVYQLLSASPFNPFLLDNDVMGIDGPSLDYPDYKVTVDYYPVGSTTSAST